MDLDKIKTIPAKLSKLSHVVEYDVAKNTLYHELVIKVNDIDRKMPSNSLLVTRITYDSEKLRNPQLVS